MESIISELWKGNIEPLKKCGKDNKELEELINLIDRNRAELYDTLNEEQKVIFEKFADNLFEYNDKLQEETFCYGFTLGSRVIIETIKKDT